MISILCPTRKRPTEFLRMVSSVLETASKPEQVEVLAYVDADDQTPMTYTGGLKVIVKVGPRQEIMTKYWNELLPLAHGDIFMQCNDDVVFKTKGWDEQVELAFLSSNDKILMVHGDDLAFGRERAAAHPFVHKAWVDTLGYFIPPYFPSDFGDTWVNELADSIGRRKFLPFVVEHMHHMVGKASIDSTTRERLERHKSFEADKMYAEYLPERLNDIAKLKAKIQKPIWSILILTQPSRRDYLAKLMDVLRPQIAGKPIELLIRKFDRSIGLGENREEMRVSARGRYSNFIDDDDLVASNYVDKILPILQKNSVDYVGFNVQCYVDGTPLPVTRHSLRYTEWGQNEKGAFRDISHLNPIRNDLALAVPMEGGYAEDHRWADALRVKRIVKKEKYIDDVMYLYYSRSKKDEEPLPVLAAKKSQDVWRPTHHQCPDCKSTCVIRITGGLRCNQCGNQFR